VRDEVKRSGRSRSVVVEELAEEAAKTRLFPGIAFRETPRRGWVIGTARDVWEILELLRSYAGDEEQLRAAHPLVDERHLRLARAYGERLPDEIAAFAEDSRRPLDELRRLYPFLATASRPAACCCCSTPTSPSPMWDAASKRTGTTHARSIRSRRWRASTMNGFGLAATEQRILVTHNVADFPRILREWAAAQRPHAGVILVYGIDHSEFGFIARGIERWLQLRPNQPDWSDFPAILDRRFAGR
jgi:hypothetical protein